MSGKSRIVADIAHTRSVPLIDIRLSQMEPTDLRGDRSDVPADIDLQHGVAAALVRRACDARDGADARRVYGHILDCARGFSAA